MPQSKKWPWFRWKKTLLLVKFCEEFLFQSCGTAFFILPTDTSVFTICLINFFLYLLMAWIVISLKSHHQKNINSIGIQDILLCILGNVHKTLIYHMLKNNPSVPSLCTGGSFVGFALISQEFALNSSSDLISFASAWNIQFRKHGNLTR